MFEEKRFFLILNVQNTMLTIKTNLFYLSLNKTTYRCKTTQIKADRPLTCDTLNTPLITDKQTIPMDW